MATSAQPQLGALRDQFPVLATRAYLNAGTDGPLPAGAVQAAGEELARAAREGRTHHHFERRAELREELRAAYAALLGCAPGDVALTTCTSEGLALVIDGLGLAPGDEILTSDEEHPGLLGALAAARDVRGARIRIAPWSELPAAVSADTRLVACSHVSWMSGRLAPGALAQLDVPVLLDGAQGVGAVPTQVGALRCAAYAGAGQKWLCGPDGTGMLYVSPELRERLAVTRRGYGNLANPGAGLQASLQPDARRLDTFSLSAEALACALGALQVLAAGGWDAVHVRAAALAEQLAGRLRAAGREVTPRDGTTLVTFSSADPVGERERLAEAGVILRDIPERPALRASVGAWNDEDDLARLIDALDAS
ncbi:MAG TPA: aminotransferase class V-fold PLP-dependent enzyme [Solirubrobacteraceae bacterium]|nr:aminotransferase class V-fold PLP-dependent enzyme [Solirubrobacteraceae bacterium]